MTNKNKMFEPSDIGKLLTLIGVYRSDDEAKVVSRSGESTGVLASYSYTGTKIEYVFKDSAKEYRLNQEHYDFSVIRHN